MFVRAIFFFLAMFVAFPASAVKGVFAVSLSDTGSELSSSTGNQEYDLNAGRGWSVAGGILVPVSDTQPHRFDVQFTVGYLTVNGQGVRWTRFPIEALYFYSNTKNRFRIGAGPLVHIQNYISAEGKNASADMRVDDAWGWTVAIEKYQRHPNERCNCMVSFGIRYNSIEYHAKGFRSSADGNGLAIAFAGFGI